MTQVIIYTNDSGNVSVCVPTGELPIQEVLAKDAPAGAIIVDDSTLPQGDDASFFDAWVLNGSTISINIEKAKTIATANLIAIAKVEAQHRMTNSSIGIDNKLSDADWIALLNTARNAISESATTTDLLTSIKPVSDAVADNVEV